MDHLASSTSCAVSSMVSHGSRTGRCCLLLNCSTNQSLSNSYPSYSTWSHSIVSTHPSYTVASPVFAKKSSGLWLLEWTLCFWFSIFCAGCRSQSANDSFWQTNTSPSSWSAHPWTVWLGSSSYDLFFSVPKGCCWSSCTVLNLFWFGWSSWPHSTLGVLVLQRWAIVVLRSRRTIRDRCSG